MAITSSAHISHFKDRGPKAIPEFAFTSYCEKPELIDKLFEYRKILGVTRYQEEDGATVTWFLNGCWYSTEQIGRMMRLKTFS